ncbi:MFS transporter [Streptomyces botrytidirepellens]|uniref:MFS transporter n=1 Tax=Streptomyces botrytidirepellens TaxID=2486417 RepID=A0A3M8TBL3_9ACTN|nr:MFS transporter [Streptomyces botrytidirepellens]RNF88092.1 MFS transporter [Streptomyces botrytidirepellens]
MSKPTSEPLTPQRASRKDWIGLAVLVIPVLLMSMDMTVLYFALPFLSASLEPSATQQLWIVDIYAFMLAGLLITMGTLGDHIGRRLLLMLGAVVFGVSSLAAAYAGSAELLIAARAVLGIAGAVLAPSTLALIRNMFHDPTERRTAIAIWTAGLSGGAALGPIVSGLLLEKFWWGSVFLINIPVMAVILLLGPLLLPEYRAPRPGRFDLLGAALSLGTVLPVIYGIKELADDGFAWKYAAITAAGVVVGVLFFLRQRSAANPLIDLSLFRDRGFSASIGVNLVALFAMVGFLLFSTQWIQLVYGLSPLKAGLWTLPAPLAVAVTTSVAAVLAKSIRPGYIIGVGMVIATAGFAVMTQLRADSSLAVAVVGATIISGGVGMAIPLTADLIVSAAPPERVGAASALPETSNQLGGALGVAILGSIGSAIYTRDVSDATSGLPHEAADAAEGSLGGAAEVAKHLPDRASEPLLQVAGEAFTRGMNISAVVAGAVMLVGAAGAAWLMRHVATPAAAPATAAPAKAEPTPASSPE